MSKRVFLLVAAGCLATIFSFGQGAVYPVSNEFCFNTSGTVRITWAGEVSNAVNSWEFSTNDGASWNSVTSTLTYYDVTTNFTGTRRYRARINVGGGIFQYSNESRIAVFAASSQGSATFNATTAQLCPNDNAGNIILNPGYVGSIIGWAKSANNNGPWTDVSNATATLPYNNLASTTYFKAVIKNGACPQILSASSAFIDVAAAPNAGDVAISSASVCASATTVNLTSSNTSATSLTWQQSSGGAFSNVFVGPSYSAPNNLTANTYTYRLVASRTCRDASDASVNKTANSADLTLLVSNTTAITNPTGNNVVANADATVRAITAAPTNGSIVRWELSTDNSQWTPLSANGTVYNYNNLTQSTFYRVVTKRNSIYSTRKNYRSQRRDNHPICNRFL